MKAELYGGALDGAEVNIPNPPPQTVCAGRAIVGDTNLGQVWSACVPVVNPEKYHRDGATESGRIRYVEDGHVRPKLEKP